MQLSGQIIYSFVKFFNIAITVTNMWHFLAKLFFNFRLFKLEKKNTTIQLIQNVLMTFQLFISKKYDKS